MNRGVKSLIFLAQFISSCCVAQWNGDAWPSETSFRLNPISFFPANNIISHKFVEEWEQVTGADYIPPLEFYQTEASSVTGGPALQIEYLIPMGKSTNGSRLFTTTRWMDICADTSTNDVAEWTGIGEFETSQLDVYEFEGDDWEVETLLRIYGTVDSKVWYFDIPQIWAWDTYMALQERYRALMRTDAVWSSRQAPMLFKPCFYREDRANLVGYKDWIAANVGSFVDTSYADAEGTFDGYFNTPTDWEWHEDIQPEVNGEIDCGEQDRVEAVSRFSWRPTGSPENFPMLTREKLVRLAGLPYEPGIVTTNTYTADVPGWFLGDTNTLLLEDATFTVVVTSAISRTWFDYTPYRDFGGWGQGLSEVTTGEWRFDLSRNWFNATQTWAFVDVVGASYLARFQPVEVAADTVTVLRATFTLFRQYSTSTINHPAQTTSIQVTSPVATPSPPITIPRSIPAYTEIITNYSANPAGGSGFITSVVFVMEYTNAVIITNNFAAELQLIATGSHEREYGYKQMPAVMEQLIWTDGGDAGTCGDALPASPTELCSSAGYWRGYGKNDVQTDNSTWIHETTNCSSYPYARKIAFSSSAEDWLEPVDECDVADHPDPNNPEVGSDCTVEYFQISPGIEYLVGSRCFERTVDLYNDPDWETQDCYDRPPVFSPWAMLPAGIPCGSYIVQRSKKCCIHYPPPYVNEIVFSWFVCEFMYIPIGTCGVNNPFPSTETDNYNWGYDRNSQTLFWNNIATHVPSDRACYISANGLDAGEQPDNESFFTSSVTRKLRQYSSGVSSQDEHTETSFCSSTKPFASNTIETRGWFMTEAKLLLKWQFNYVGLE